MWSRRRDGTPSHTSVHRSGIHGLVQARFLLLIICALWSALAYESGDYVSSISQTLHNKWKTPKMELPLRHLPRFREPAAFVMHATIPGQQGDEAEMDFNTTGAKSKDFHWKAKNVKVNPEADVKISFTFANNKVLIPWLSVFDAKKRRSLERLEVTFEHDQYDVLEVRYNRVYGREIQRLDASHPSVVGFEMVYQWVQADDTDFSSGIFEMFLMSLLCGFVIIGMVLCYEGDTQPRVQPKKIQAARSSGNRVGTRRR